MGHSPWGHNQTRLSNTQQIQEVFNTGLRLHTQSSLRRNCPGSPPLTSQVPSPVPDTGSTIPTFILVLLATLSVVAGWILWPYKLKALSL